MGGTAIVWVAEGTWPACIDAARNWVPPDDDIVLLHVGGSELAAAHGALAGLLGRGRGGPGGGLDGALAGGGAARRRASTRCPPRPSPACWTAPSSGWAGLRRPSSAPAASSARWWRRPRTRSC